jgi:predicted dehydrogenase
MTFVARFEQATLEFADLVGPFKVYPVEGEPFTPEISAEQGYYLEIAYFLDCVARGEQPTVVTPQQARESVRIVQAEAESLRTGKPVVL